MSIEVGNALWCRDLIDELKDGGVWGIPRSGVIFRKTGRDRMTWVANMPARLKGGELHREKEYRTNHEQFGSAGITIDREETLMEFDNIDAARDYYCIGGETLIGDSFSQSRLNPGLDYRQGETGMRELEKLNKMLPDSVSQSRLNPRDHYSNIRTQRPTGNDHSIAKMLLRGTKVSPDAFKNHAGPLAPPLEIDDRPLIDKLHEATFTDTIGMQWFKDKYALRMLLRKAHCFTLDKTTSALIADFSIAIAPDLESARRLAIPPFPVTWIEIDNVARLNRIKEMGIPLTKTAAGETEAGAPVPRVGWLITPGAESGYNATYVVQLDSGMASAPLSSCTT